jgi:colanic acid/amylovoran biosynthesis glycosyltransferase
MELKEGITPASVLRNLYCSAHIFPYTLDWLHFGFVTLAVGRENVARTIDAKMGVSFRGYDVSIFPLKHPGVYNRVWKKVDKIHTISDDLYAIGLSLGLSADVPMMKIMPAIRASDFALRINEYHRTYGEPIQITTTARLHWKKGIDIALAAMRLLKDRGIEFHFNIMGDGEEYEKLVCLRSILNLQKEVTFHGKICHKELLERLHRSDIYIQPSIQEGFCNSVLEAQASGLLCIVSNAEGLSENVLNQVTGWVVPKLDANILALKIQEVLNMPEEQKERIRGAAIARVKEYFDLQQHRKLFPKFFD